MSSQFPSMMALFQSFIPGFREVDGGDCLTLAQQICQATSGIVARAGGNAAAGTLLGYGWNSVDTVASGNDSVRLPPAIPGSFLGVLNTTANSMQVFGQQANQGGLAAGDTIVPYNSNTAAAVATGIAQTAHQLSIFICFTAGVWKQALFAN